MACRIGITTDPNRRKGEWGAKYPKLSGWAILGTYNSKSDAQDAETSFARLYGGESAPGGAGSERDTWYVYKFNY